MRLLPLRNNTVLAKVLRKQRFGSGFTLIEFSVATGIVIVVSAIVLVNYRSAAYGESMVRNAYTLSADVRFTQNTALAPNVPSLQAYGVFFDTTNPTRYVLFLDRNGNQSYDPPPAGSCRGAASECLQQKLFETRAQITNLRTVSTGGARSTVPNLTVLFCPPYGTTLLYGQGSRGAGCSGNQATMQSSAVITLSVVGLTVSPRAQRNVVISGAGAVEVVDDSQT